MPLLVVNCSLGTSETGTLTVLILTNISSVPMLCFFITLLSVIKLTKVPCMSLINVWKISEVGFLQLLDRLKWAKALWSFELKMDVRNRNDKTKITEKKQSDMLLYQNSYHLVSSCLEKF